MSQSKGLRRLLDDEPALTLRVLTDPLGPVQPRVVAFVESLLRRDIAEFGLVTLAEPNALAYALVRLAESFLYADVLAARTPDVATANRLAQALIEGSQVSQLSGGSPGRPASRSGGRASRIRRDKLKQGLTAL